MTPLAPALAGVGVLLTGHGSPHRPIVGVLAAGGRLAPTEGFWGGARRGRWIGAGAGQHARRLGPVLLGSAVFAVLAGGALVLAAAVCLAVVALLARDVRRRRRAAAASDRVVESVRLLGAELAAGATLARALEAAAEVASEHAPALREAAAQARTAGDPAAPLSATGEPALLAVGHALRVAEGCGAPVSGVLARVQSDVEARRRNARELSAALAGPLASCATLAGLPGLGIGLGALMGARPAVFLVGESGGRTVCCVGVVLDALGVLWVRRIVQRAVPP
jgi:tight adherence protein B